VKVLILYTTRYGTTERYASLLGERLPAQVVLADLRRPGRLSLEGFDAVLLGSPIYGGSVPAGVLRFCERRRQELSRLRVGLFICCLYEGQRAQAQLDSAFPDWLALHAFGRWALGGEIRLARLRVLDRLLVKAVVRPAVDISRFRPEDLEPIVGRVREVLEAK
jgi:menaquinone-dependent protoporphyrinogen oxidase